jgi:hypothetical protein
MLDVRENLVYLYQLLSPSTFSFLMERAYGLGATQISRGQEQKSVSRETTVHPFVAKMEDIRAVFKSLAEVLERDLIIEEDGRVLPEDGDPDATKDMSKEDGDEEGTFEDGAPAMPLVRERCPVEDGVEIIDDQYLLDMEGNEEAKDQHQRQRALHIGISKKQLDGSCRFFAAIFLFFI